MLIGLLVSMVVVIVVLCRWKRQKNKNCDKDSEKLRAKSVSEETPLLQEGELPFIMHVEGNFGSGKIHQVYCKNIRII